MSRNGSGDFSLLSTFAVANEEPTATAHNAIMDDIADGLSDSVNKDGTKAFAADQSMGGFKLTNVGGATARTGAANLSQVQDGNANWAIAGGTVDAITVTLSPAADALHQGMEVKFRASGANTITAPTLNVNGLGALIIYKNGEQPLVAGDIYGDGHECTVRLNITDTPDRWELLNPRYPSAAVTAATTTEALTGTDTAKFVTADALAALWEKGSDTASATTVSVAEGGYLHITGTTTITDIDFATAKDGRAVTVQFDGILTLTHNATTLVLPGGANITTAAGDTACFVQDSSDNIKCLWYTRAALAPLTGSGTAPTYACRAWVRFDGTGTPAITAAGNVASITDNGVGDYTVTFTTAMPDANYCVSATAITTSGKNVIVAVNEATAPATTAVRIKCTEINFPAGSATTAAYDPASVYVAVFR